MLSQKSIRTKFLIQLVLTSSALIVIFSTILYHYIKISIIQAELDYLTEQANLIKTSKFNIKKQNFRLYRTTISQGITKVEIIKDANFKKKPIFKDITQNNQDYISLLYPLDKNGTLLSLTREITATNTILRQILIDILVINLTAIFLIIFYALFLSRMLLVPIKTLNYKLNAMNEKFLKTFEVSNLPDEFVPLGVGINRLIERIQTFIKYQKELFIGAAHELKTPLAVMKTKNEVTLIKERDTQKYIEALKKNNQSINEMNTMISSILEIGRQEGDQFEEPVEFDLVRFLNEKAKNFTILAKQENKNIIINLSPKEYIIKAQPTLLLHILQNFVQNAIKFSQENQNIEIKSYKNDAGFCIQVLDEGDGIDESKDLFAPFKRYGNKGGAGLGLFLAKAAADALNAEISIKNREKGAVATLFIPKINSEKTEIFTLEQK